MKRFILSFVRCTGVLCLGSALSGCGAGIAAVVIAVLNPSDGGSPNAVNSATLVSDVRLAGSRTSPQVTFLLTDRESDPTDVEVTFKVEPRSGPSGTIARRPGLATSPAGARHEVAWDFERILGAGYTAGLTVAVAVQGGEAVSLQAQAVGNDPPVILEVKAPLEPQVVGIAKIDLKVSDSSSDLVSILAEYLVPSIDAEEPAPAWNRATQAGSPLQGIQVPREGREVNFFWDVKKDLGTVKREVLLRFTPDDGFESGMPSDPLALDVNNNSVPIVRILGRELAENPDHRRGIPVPFEVRDANGDDVQVVFQWSFAGRPFPELPADPVQIATLLRDPAMRRSLQIATERPIAFEGLLSGVDIQRVRLPELASTASPLLKAGMENRELEVLRDSRFRDTAGGASDLRSPVAAVPLEDGIRALVLDKPSSGSWRLREMDLGSGEVTRLIAASGDGDPSALALEPGEASALVALDQEGIWKVLRVGLGELRIELLISRGDSPDHGPIRALAVLGPGSALATAGGSLLRLDTSGPETAKASLVVTGLRTPWGIAADPSKPGHVYLAESDFEGLGPPGRIVVLDLNTLERRTIAARGIVSPEAIALESGGKRLLAVTDAGVTGLREVREIDLPAGGEARKVGEAFQGPIGSIATGKDSLHVLALTALHRIAAGSGVEARRKIIHFDMALKEATLERPLKAPLDRFRRWRILDRLRPIRARPEGTRGVFVWDSADAAPRGEVVFRATPIDSEVGNFGESEVAHSVEVISYAEPLTLGGKDWTYLPQSSAAADLNGDGRLDLVSANDSSLAVFFQKGPLVFPVEPDLTLTGLRGGNAVSAADLDGDALADAVAADSKSLLLYFQKSPGGLPVAPDLALPGLEKPRCIAIGDLDGDGDLDLVTADSEGNSLSVFAQKGEGSRSFDRKALLSPAPPGVPSDPSSVALGDLDGDGRLDIVSASESLDALAVFFQGGGGAFPEAPGLNLGSPSKTSAPESLVVDDLNGDGRQDLASANQLSGTLALFFQMPRGGFPAAPSAALEGLAGPRSIAVADLDGDSALDLISANVDGGDLTGFLQRGPGDFGPKPDLKIPIAGVSPRPVSVLAADLEGDGTPELVSTNALGNDHTVFSFTGGGGGRFSRTPDLFLGGPAVTAGPYSLAVGDLDGDGDLDLLSANEAGNDVAVFIQASTASFENRQSLKIGITIGFTPSVLAIDLDGDGELEAVLRQGGRMEVFFQSRPGLFEETAGLAPGPIDGNGQIIGRDLDRNGLPDLAVVNSDYLSVLFQKEPGEFLDSTTQMKIPRDTNLGGPWTLTSGDFDGDGDLDLASANSGGSPHVTVFFRSASGEFPSAPDLKLGGKLVEEGAVPIGAADLDADGSMDLITATHQELKVFYQRAAPVFFDALPDLTLGGPGLTDYPSWISVGDLDGDGDQDLVCANQLGNSLAVFFQDSSGSFPKMPDLTMAGIEEPTCVLAADLDGDGDLDLMSANRSGNNLAVFYGTH